MIYNDINFNDKTILITGGAGFIGSNLAFYFQDNFRGAEIVIFDCFRNLKLSKNGQPSTYGHYKNLIGFRGKILCGNINIKDDLKLLNNYKFDYIFHQAAISDTRNYDQESILQTNVNSFYYFLNKAKEDRSVIIYASSAATYGNLPPPQSIGIENPENPYGFSKYCMDQIAYSFAEENPEISIVGLRFFNVYGNREFFKNNTSSMVIQLGHQILDNKSPRLFNNSHKIFRDFIYIEDIIQANIKACNSKLNGVYNIGTGISRSFKDIVDILQIELETNLEIDYFPNPLDDYQLNTQADITLSKEYLNFEPRYTLEQGIKDYLPEIIRLHSCSRL